MYSCATAWRASGMARPLLMITVRFWFQAMRASLVDSRGPLRVLAASLQPVRRGWLVVLVVILSVAGCGGGSGGGSHAPTASTVSVQPGDLPAGMARCDLTGDIESFLNKEKTADPSTYNSTK